MKPKIFFQTTFIFFLLSFVFAQATVRYVSPTGSSTPPYTSWETAADSIMECINISVFGDTIYVANGTYKEQVVMIPGLSLIGAGMDSCVIDTREFAQPSGFKTLIMVDTCTVNGFNIIVSPDQQSGIGILHGGIAGIFSDCKVSQAALGISLISSNLKVKNNQIVSCNEGVSIAGFSTNYIPIIEQNVFLNQSSYSILVLFGTKPTIRNNIIYLDGNFAYGYYGGGSDTAFVYNNLILSVNGKSGLQNSIVPTKNFNNTLTGIFTFRGIDLENFNKAIGNNIFNSTSGLIQDQGETPVIQYNNSWNNDVNYSGFTPDSTNLSVDPMIVNDDSTKGDLDFHLQKYSPLIDAGDPNVLDKDSTRSDIGLYGGPFGESYSYFDLAPRVPVNLNATLDSLTVGITWNKNTETDFNNYNVYRDTTKNFTIDSTNLFLSTPVANLIDILPDYLTKIYYKVTAVDNQGNESEPSEEVGFVLTSITDQQQTISNYQLYQNYPNPFNPSTKISYRLKERGYVKLYVYDIKGELVSVLVNQTQEAGFYEVEFTTHNQPPTTNNLASGIYIYQIMVKNENKIPVFTDMKKMIFLK
ncbi:MAG: T9SS type A sorting domain-containing protein [Ignavibacteriales bacterium]|nr:T9SS type A sorting domain-containing protein [Ignavibacteriales bacterium]